MKKQIATVLGTTLITLFSLTSVAQTKFEVLKNNYLASTQPASPSDLPDLEHIQKTNEANCILKSSDVDPIYYLMVRQATIHEEGHGPLFPSKSYGVIAFGNIATLSLTNSQLIALFPTAQKGIDTVVSQTQVAWNSLNGQETADGIYTFKAFEPGKGDDAAVYFRKSNQTNTVSFKYVEKDLSTNTVTVYYGYCY